MHKRLIISKEFAGTAVRYNLRVTKEVADKYARTLKENPEMDKMKLLYFSETINGID